MKIRGHKRSKKEDGVGVEKVGEDLARWRRQVQARGLGSERIALKMPEQIDI